MSDTHILYTALQQRISAVPFHMPGHKRKLCPVPTLPYGWDVTEISGTDDLHNAGDILQDAMDRTAALHGAERTWYLVNGSTCGLLAGIRSFAKQGSTIICARNCHKSVYHAIELGSLTVRWLDPPCIPEIGICGSIPPKDVTAALQDCPEAACVVLTSPTYEGVLSDISAIADICHSFGVPLLVDEAHGAHLGLGEGWPKSAVQSGADLVVQSAHKTLPSLTQTALLHMGKGSLADPSQVERQLDIFETSSPSYPLLASLDGCTGLMTEKGQQIMGDWLCRLQRFALRIRDLKHLTLPCHTNIYDKIYRFDPSKLTLSTAGTNMTGTGLAQCLRGYGIETEMAEGDICLAMTGPGDTEEDMDRLADALLSIDHKLTAISRHPIPTLPPISRTCCTISEALLRPAKDALFRGSEGNIAGEYLWAYPPGIPLIAPGEVITEEFLQIIRALREAGTEIYHSHCKKPGYIRLLS